MRIDIGYIVCCNREYGRNIISKIVRQLIIYYLPVGSGDVIIYRRYNYLLIHFDYELRVRDFRSHYDRHRGKEIRGQIILLHKSVTIARGNYLLLLHFYFTRRRNPRRKIRRAIFLFSR